MAQTNFNTANSTFRQLFGNGLSYHVPPFQRDYSWGEDEWDDLWQDILALFEKDGREKRSAEASHYMGYLVLQTSDDRRFEIIDGQQRMTTISVLILAALSHLQDLVDSGLDGDSNTKRMEQLRSSYIGYLDPVSLKSESKLSLNRHNNSFYQTYLIRLSNMPERGLNASERLLRKSFQWFKDKIGQHCGKKADSGLKTAKLIDRLVDRLFFTTITVSDELNAFTVFETLNSRGVRLSATDLLKNHLFSIISGKDMHDSQIQYLESRWEHIVGLLGVESFPEFLRVFWNSHNRLTRKTELFKTIKGKVTSHEEAFDLLANLDNSAEVYAALRDPHDKRWDRQERISLKELAMFGVRQPLSMLMACYTRFYESDRDIFTRILKMVSVLSFRYNVICGLASRDQEMFYNDLAIKISEGTLNKSADIAARMRDIYPQDTHFKAAFEDKELRTTISRNRKIVRHILFTIERQQTGRDLDESSARYTLEHILPEHPADGWGHVDEAMQERLVYRLGNMTLLEAARNRKSANHAYPIKRKVFQGSALRVTKAISEHYETWDENTVESRQKQLAKIACGIWKIN